MILLDTNVISETWRIHPAMPVIAWLDAKPPRDLFICAPVLAELRYGAALMPMGRRRLEVERAIDLLEKDRFTGRILPFDHAAAGLNGALRARARLEGRSMPLIDSMIAAIALAHGYTLATRNVADFVQVGLPLVNPFVEP